MVKNKLAFSFIEILITVTIMSIFSGIALASYNKQTAYKKLEMETSKLIDILELAKKKATSSDYGDVDDCDFKGYDISFSATTYSLNLLCTGSTPYPTLINTYQLTNTVSISLPAGPIIFSPSGSNNLSLQTIVLTESNTATTATIDIKYGNISKR